MNTQFDVDRVTLEDAMEQAAEQFGFHIAETQFGDRHMDWTVSGGEIWGGGFTFDFKFHLEDGTEAQFQMQIVGARNMEIGCPECERSYGPDYDGPCDH